MTGQDFQDKLDAVVVDLQTKGKGQTVHMMFRDATNVPQILPLSSDSSGVVNAAQFAAIQAFINPLKIIANDFTTSRVPVQASTGSVQHAQAPHETLIEEARVARVALQTALDGDANYQAAKLALETARADGDYIGFGLDYQNNNVAENYAEIQRAKGSYAV